MNRREFMGRNLASAAGASFLAAGLPGLARADEEPPAAPPKADDVRRHLVGLGAGWINAKGTVDTIKAGDPETVVEGIAVCWMGYASAMREAHRLGCNLLVVHEPIYYNHRDDPIPNYSAVQEKKKFLEESGLVVVRCHDVWDRVAKIGIRDAWAEFLGLGEEIDRDNSEDATNGAPFCGVYEIEPVAAAEFARRVAGKVAALGQRAVELVGPADKVVRRVAVGTGAITPFEQMVFDLKADLAVCSDDGFCYWRSGALAIDMNVPVVLAAHGVSEEPGVRRLAEHLAKTYPGVPVRCLEQQCMFRTLRGSQRRDIR
ncbi:MAG: Nif3-like dinuclear metal center hexameric protein [Pirellulales bacterium]|nr:Nif3-like dinuclear metal center hexameric protein [Pirellulales bacterium]